MKASDTSIKNILKVNKLQKINIEIDTVFLSLIFQYNPIFII